jgi:hypothetical protein
LSLTLDDIPFLTSAAGEHLLRRLHAEDLSDSHSLQRITRLRKEYPAEAVRSALELATIRQKAVVKFGEHAAHLFLTQDALEQASDPMIRQGRAQRIHALHPAASLVDACCSVGSDSLALAEAGLAVTGIDCDPLRIAFARLNATVLGSSARFEVGDVTAGIPDAALVFFDPGRRTEQGKRIHSVDRYLPPLSTLRHWDHALVIAKLSPGIDLDELSTYTGRVEFVSVDGDLKEANLWHGEEGTFRGLQATLYHRGEVLTWDHSSRLPIDIQTPIREPQGWLLEPDPALIRAGLVQSAAEHFQGALLDSSIAYLTTEQHVDSPWVRAWRIRDWMPFHIKRLRAYLQERRIGTLTVKKRGTAVTPDILIPQLKLKGDQSCTVVLTRLEGRQIVIICDDHPV